MDTISSRENSSYLPVAGVIVGVLALVLSGVALAKISSLSKKVPDGLVDSIAKIDTIEGEVRNATSAAERASSGIASLSRSSQDAFNAVAGQIGEVRAEVAKMQEAAKAAPKAAAGTAGKTPKAPAVAGEGEYIIKAGDTGMKIAKALGVTVEDLKTVNPSVNWGKLKVGDKIKLPKK